MHLLVHTGWYEFTVTYSNYSGFSSLFERERQPPSGAVTHKERLTHEGLGLLISFVVELVRL